MKISKDILPKLVAMAAWLLRGLGAVLTWPARRPGYLVLTASDEVLAQDAPGRYRLAWIDLMVLSLVWGEFLGWLWGTAWTVFGDYSGLYLMHVATVTAATALWLYRRSLLALGECLAPTESGRALLVTVSLLVLVLTLLGLRRSYDPDWQVYLPSPWNWLYPMVVQRVLVLGPLWGAWAMLIACQFCKASERTEPAVAAMARGCSPVAAAMLMALPLGGTVVYLNFLAWWRLVLLAGLTLLAAILGGQVLCRRGGGLSRRVLLAVNFLTQLAFLVAYLAARGR